MNPLEKTHLNTSLTIFFFVGTIGSLEFGETKITLCKLVFSLFYDCKCLSEVTNPEGYLDAGSKDSNVDKR